MLHPNCLGEKGLLLKAYDIYVEAVLIKGSIFESAYGKMVLNISMT